MLAQIFSIEAFKGSPLFKGGTSLSKGFGVIERFSEDIDLAVDYAMLGFTGVRDPIAPDLSRTKQTALLAEMLGACQTYISGAFLDPLRERIVEVLCAEVPGRLAVDEKDPNIVRFSYPPAVKGQVAHLAPQVILELGTHAEFNPRGDFAIRSFAAAEFPKLFEQADVPVTSLRACGRVRAGGQRVRRTASAYPETTGCDRTAPAGGLHRAHIAACRRASRPFRARTNAQRILARRQPVSHRAGTQFC